MVTKAVYTEQEYGIHHIIPEKPPSKENRSSGVLPDLNSGGACDRIFPLRPVFHDKRRGAGGFFDGSL